MGQRSRGRGEWATEKELQRFTRSWISAEHSSVYKHRANLGWRARRTTRAVKEHSPDVPQGSEKLEDRTGLAKRHSAAE